MKSLKDALVYLKSNLIDSDSNMCLTVDFLLGINKIIVQLILPLENLL